MSRELLKKCRDTLQTLIECDDDHCQDLMRLVSEIDACLAQPEPESVAWMWEDGLEVYFENSGDPDHNWVPLYTSPPDQSARIAELAADGVRLMETITELRNQLVTPNWENNRLAMQVGEIKELKQQLAALQAKREPLSDGELDSLRQNDTGKLNFVTLREFRVIARAIEAAHGIAGGVEI